MPGLLWTLVGVDKASPAFARVAGAADKTAAATLRAQKNTAGAVAGMNRTGATLSKRLTLPLLAVGAVAVSSAAKFQKATSVYVTAAGESAKNLGVVRSGIKKTAMETGTSIDQLTAAQYLLEKANIRGAASQKLLNAAAKGAIEENANLADVVQGATSVMASYHIGTDKSVQVINALKTGAGSAKTTMEEYVKSLATVIPVASAAGVSLDQTLGAISTLTQHGTSAQEATQELAFAIRNLQAPNNVAVAAMNQLGISSVNVSQNLGKRGLTGTLQYIESKLPKTGLVYLTAMKQMEAGTADLTAMQAKMTPQLRKVSQGFLDGSVSAKDYRATYKGLGADGNAQGSQFLALATRVRGYNDSLKAGTPAQKTMAAELKAIFGGAVGLNTALQLGGSSLAGFKQRTEAVGHSLHNTSKDVEGWRRTSKLASVQADRFKESLHVLAINAGTAALPALTSLAQKATGVVSSFQGLSSTQKKIGAWSLGVAVAIGPVLSITGKLASVGSAFARFSTAAVGQMARFNTRLALNAQGVSAAMGKVGAAVGGAAIGVAVGTLTANASTAVKAVGVLGSAAAGAAIGFGAGGGIGAVIGGVAGGLSALATQFFGAGHAAKAAIKPTDDYTSALLNDKNAIGANTAALVANSLQKAGLYDAGLKLGISQRTLTLAAQGNAAALQQVRSAQIGLIGSTGATTAAGKKLSKSQNAALDASGKLTDGIAGLNTTLSVNKHAAENVAAGLGTLGVGLIDVSAKGKLTAANLYKLGGIEVNPKIAADPTKARLVISGLTRDINAIRQSKNPKLNADSALGKAVVKNLQSQINQLRGKTVSVNANTGTAAANIAFIRQQLAELPSYKTITVTTRTVGGLGNTTNSQVPAKARGKASGGAAPEGYFSVGEEGPEIVRKRGSRVDIMSNPASKAFIAATGARFPGFAKGTKYTVAGTTYASSSAAGNALGRVRKALDKAAAALENVAKKASSSHDSLVAAAQALAARAKADGVSAAAQKRISNLTGQITHTADARNRALSKVASLKTARGEESSTIQGATRSSFDITTAGQNAAGGVSLGGILAQGKQQAGIAARFTAGLKKLRKEGLQLGVIKQLAEAGPSAWPQVQELLKATPKQLSALNGNESSISASGKSLGDFVGGQMYDGKIKTAQATANHEQKKLTSELRALRLEIAKDKRAITVNIDGKKSQKHLQTAANKNKRRK